MLNKIKGNCAEHSAKKDNISREEQDEHAIESYKRLANAYSVRVSIKRFSSLQHGEFRAEMITVQVPGPKKGEMIVATEDEECSRFNVPKVKTLKPAFDPKGMESK